MLIQEEKVSLPPYLSDMMFHSRLPSRCVMISQVIRTQIDLTMVFSVFISSHGSLQ